MKATKKTEPVARLTMVVEYETLPADDEIERVLDAAREYGAIKSAQFETLALVKRDVKNGVR